MNLRNIPSKIELWLVDRLLPYVRNARTHSEAQVAQVAASIKEFGWTDPILVGMHMLLVFRTGGPPSRDHSSWSTIPGQRSVYISRRDAVAATWIRFTSTGHCSYAGRHSSRLWHRHA